MAFQPETSAWASGVYQWETTDPAQGGLGGVMNTPLLQLSNRTVWLKGQVEALAASIAGGAPLNSPAFIGNPTGPTAPQFDNDTSLATTAFVQRALGNMAGYDAYSASATLTASQAGRQILYYGSAGSFALPAVSGLVAGAGFWILNVGGSTLTVQRSGSDALLGVNGATSVVLGSNDSLYVVSAGNGSQWVVFGGSSQLTFSSAFGNKANTSGSYPGLSVGSATSAGNADTVDGWHRDDIRSFPNLLNKPTTLGGYGITDALPISGGMAFGTIGVSSVSEAQLQVSLAGQPVAYLYSNASGWGLYSGAGGGIVSYTRADGKVRVGGVDTSLIVENNGGTYGINITGNSGNADTVDGYHASQLWRADMASSWDGGFKLPNGWIIQMGKSPAQALGARPVTFPVSFPNAVISVSATKSHPSNSSAVPETALSANTVSLSGMTLGANDNGYDVFWIAIGK